MLKRVLAEIEGTERDVETDWWRSRRLIVAQDGRPYSFHVTNLRAGADLEFEYAGHNETVYCVSGSGVMEDLQTGEPFPIAPGSLYSVGVGEPHRVIAETDLMLVCVFDPPLVGGEEGD